jgi:hypothetical protein
MLKPTQKRYFLKGSSERLYIKKNTNIRWNEQIIKLNWKSKSHLLKLENTLFSLATIIQQRHLLDRKKESIAARKENAYFVSQNK